MSADRSLLLQSSILRLLADRHTDRRLGRGRQYLSEAVRGQFRAPDIPSADEIQQGFWSLIGQGLAFIDMLQPTPDNWELKLTSAGVAAVRDQEFNPDDASGFLERLINEIPSLSEVTSLYLREAVRA